MSSLTLKEAKNLLKKLEEKDSFTAEHTRRVADMAEKFAVGMGWKKSDVRALKIAGLLHDMGKLDLPDTIFEKIRKGEKLTREETAEIRTHAGRTDILDKYEKVPQLVRDVLLYHHERFDGRGYPYKLKGEDIPEGVRMLTIADFFDTVVVQRPWKTPELQKPLGKHEGIRTLIDESFARFDPNMVKEFIKIVLEENS
jgi:HD-GYP domain-containing protein (c-di-GMP phosphodiesterase class II)